MGRFSKVFLFGSTVVLALVIAFCFATDWGLRLLQHSYQVIAISFLIYLLTQLVFAKEVLSYHFYPVFQICLFYVSFFIFVCLGDLLIPFVSHASNGSHLSTSFEYRISYYLLSTMLLFPFLIFSLFLLLHIVRVVMKDLLSFHMK